MASIVPHQMFAVILLLIGIILPLKLVYCVDPKFDPSTRMRLVLVPADAAVGSVIYRLRATDEEFDYPLVFEFVGDASSSTVKIESLPCTKYNSVCQANVVLQKRLEPGRYYDFQVSVKDTKGGMTTQLCSITATNFSTPHDLIFPHKPGIVMIPEDAKRGTELDYVIARKNPLTNKPVYLELWGSPLFALRQKIVSTETTEGTIYLLGPLDFEKQAMYHLTLLANDAYAEPGQDSRNIAGMEIVVIVQDVQDVPPVFTNAPPVTKLPQGLLPGDKILQVHAEDGDKGNPREIRYGLVSEGNPFTSFFDINDTSGEIFLMRPLEEITAITHIGDPVLLTVIAEEVKVGRDEPPAMASTVQLAFILPDRTNSPPYFENDHYVSRVDENAPQGTALTFLDPYIPRVYDDDTGKNGVFSLTLLNNNGTFEITPNVAERSSTFLIRVRDNVLLDFEERHSVEFQILAQELGPATNLSATVNVTVYINDVNDNPPVFTETMYTVELPENMTVGTKVVQVHADDIDTGIGGRVRYTAILGYLNTSLNLDAETGLITVSTNIHGFDREIMPEYHLYVEARDNDGNGNRAQVPLIIKMIDVNDETPMFERPIYEFILASDLMSFTTPAFIKAIDKDATAPNNEVRYEILNGNYDNKFYLNKVTGELTILEKINLRAKKNVRQRRQLQIESQSHNQNQQPQPQQYQQQQQLPENNIFVLTARAYDLGVPVRSSTAIIRIYPPESRTRIVTFVVPGYNPDKRKTEETLSTVTGGKVIIHEIRPLLPDEPGAKGLIGSSPQQQNLERSVVTATVLYDSDSVVDISQIQHRLSQHNSSYVIMPKDMQQTRTEVDAETLYKAENKLLFWLLVLLACLIAFTILTLLLCCICSWCPLYGATSKRIININNTEDDVHLVHRELSNKGKQTKSVQVAEWMGRREAWSAEKSSDSRTKPTRWEFRNSREHPHERIEDIVVVQASEAINHKTKDERDRKIRSAEDHRRVKIRSSHQTTKDESHNVFHNSRTNLINDNIYIEDVGDNEQNIGIGIYRENNNINGKHQSKKQQYLTSTAERQQQIDDDSMRRHEIDRGSDIDFNGRNNSLKTKREYFIKDGNAEILQLMTRGDKTEADENIYVNLPMKPSTTTNLTHPQLLMVENSGKEILMRRFIEEQPDGKQIIREHYQIVPGATYIQTLPNEVSTLPKEEQEHEIKIIHTQQEGGNIQHAQSTQSLHLELENSLKQQNALLRQILLEKEKLEIKYNQNETMLETQSLPCQSLEIATQTDCEMGTQTDPVVERVKSAKKKRRSRSENDDSEEEFEYVHYSPPNSPEGVYWIKRRKQKKKSRGPRKRIVMVDEIKRKIRTPIKEEDDEFYEYRKASPPKKPTRNNGETKTSMLRRMKNEKLRDEGRNSSGSSLNHRILMEISDSLDEDHPSEEDYENDSDADQIVIKTNDGFGETQTFSNGHRFEIRLSEGEQSNGPNPKPRLSRRDNQSKSYVSRTGGQTSSEPPNNRITITRSSIAPKKTPRERNYQSETDLLDHEDRSVPKYMDWYYGKSKNGSSSRENTLKKDKKNTTKIKIGPNKKVVSGLERKIKQRQTRSDETDDRISHKPEPAPRKSPPKNGRLLKEDVMMNKTHKPKIETETNHPLLQHSEHRFEREYESEVPIAPTKLPHYMYPETPPFKESHGKKPIRDYKPKPSPIKENEIKITNSKINLYIEDTDSKTKQLNVSTLEDDLDSGIAMNSLLHSMGRRNPIAEKKSVFSIAYDDISRVKKIQSESDSPQYS